MKLEFLGCISEIRDIKTLTVYSHIQERDRGEYKLLKVAYRCSPLLLWDTKLLKNVNAADGRVVFVVYTLPGCFQTCTATQNLFRNSMWEHKCLKQWVQTLPSQLSSTVSVVRTSLGVNTADKVLAKSLPCDWLGLDFFLQVPSLTEDELFSVGENASDMDNHLLCATCVKKGKKRCWHCPEFIWKSQLLLTRHNHLFALINSISETLSIMRTFFTLVPPGDMIRNYHIKYINSQNRHGGVKPSPSLHKNQQFPSPLLPV